VFHTLSTGKLEPAVGMSISTVTQMTDCMEKDGRMREGLEAQQVIPEVEDCWKTVGR
jgi:hypothetical protein